MKHMGRWWCGVCVCVCVCVFLGGVRIIYLYPRVGQINMKPIYGTFTRPMDVYFVCQHTAHMIQSLPQNPGPNSMLIPECIIRLSNIKQLMTKYLKLMDLYIVALSQKHTNIVYLKILIHFHRSCVTGLAKWHPKTQYIILKCGNDLYNIFIYIYIIYQSKDCSVPTRCCTDGIRKPLISTHGIRDKMAVIWQTISSHAFSWIKMFEFRLKYHWNLFPRFQFPMCQHRFR